MNTARSLSLNRALFVGLFFFAICKLFSFVVIGNYANIFSGSCSVLFAFLLLARIKPNNTLSLILIYSLILCTLSFFALDVFEVAIGFTETISPYIILACCLNRKLIQSFGLSEPFLKRFIFILYILLVAGALLQLLGLPLPVMKTQALLENQTSTFVSSRLTSFVGTSGPFAMSLSYLSIGLFASFPAFRIPIFVFTNLVQLVSFSRSGLAIFNVFIVFYVASSIIKNYSFSIKHIPKKLFYCFLAVIAGFLSCLVASSGDLIAQFLNNFYNFINAFNYYTDTGTNDRINRLLLGIQEHKDSNFLSIFLGDGTGITSRFLGGYQAESQLVKIYIEWGFIGIFLVISYFINAIKSFNLHPLAVALYFTVFLNMAFIQLFTSPPCICPLR